MHMWMCETKKKENGKREPYNVTAISTWKLYLTPLKSSNIVKETDLNYHNRPTLDFQSNPYPALLVQTWQQMGGTIEIKLRSGRMRNRKYLFPCLVSRHLIKTASKQKVKITFRAKILQVTPLRRHFYGNGSILIQHWLNPVRFNTVSIHKRNFCLLRVKTGSLG